MGLRRAAAGTLGLLALTLAARPQVVRADEVLTEKADYAARTRDVTVTFHSEVDPHVPVIVRPLTLAKRARRDVPYQVFFRFTNLADTPQHIRAVHQISPDYAEQSFRKLACFCFDEQTLEPHESRDMSVVFTIAPDLAMETDAIDLTYVTFESAGAAKNAGTITTVSKR